MNIAFWSNARGAGVTSNVAALSTAAVMGYPWKITIFENHCSMNNLAKCFLSCGRGALLREASGSYYANSAADDFIRQISLRMNRRIIDSSAMEIIENSLYYVYQDPIVSIELFEYEFYYKLYPLLEQTMNFSDLCFIDTAYCNNLSTKEVINKADMVVICLKQDPNQIEHFFEEYSSIRHKSIYVISDYQSKNPMTIKRIAETFGIPINNIGCIPHSLEFKEALDQGRIVEFINRSFRLKRDAPEYSFMKAVKRMSYILIDRILELNSGVIWRRAEERRA